MENLGYRVVLALVVVVAAGSLLVLLAAALTRPSPRRAALVATGLPLALLTSVFATAYACGRQMGFFGGMEHGDGPAFLAQCRSLWQLQVIAWAGVAAVCLAGFALGLAGALAHGAGNASGSRRRQVVLLLLPLVALLVAGALTRELARALRLATAIFSTVEDDALRRAQLEGVLEELGLPKGGSGSLAATARFIDRGSAIGMFGGATAGVALLGLALTGTILAWRTSFGHAARLAASVLWLLGAATGLLVAGVVDPLRLP